MRHDERAHHAPLCGIDKRNPSGDGSPIEPHTFSERGGARDDHINLLGEAVRLVIVGFVVDSFDGDETVHRAKVGGEMFCTWVTKDRLAAKDLSVEIGGNHIAAVRDDHTANAGKDQGESCRTSHPAGAGDQDRGRFQLTLCIGIEYAASQLAVVSLQFLVG